MRLWSGRGGIVGTFGLRRGGFARGASGAYSSSVCGIIGEWGDIRLRYKWQAGDEDESWYELESYGQTPTFTEAGVTFPMRNSVTDPERSAY